MVCSAGGVWERGTRSQTPQKNLFGFWGELPVSKYMRFMERGGIKKTGLAFGLAALFFY
jgi:hypothetical protein